MPIHDALGQRMKIYEGVTKGHLMRRTPVAIRLDGRAFHTFTKGFKRPFDDIFAVSMEQTMQYLCENISGCVLGYHQSDEITLILCDYQTLETQPWFDNEILKICSISASMATMAFNKFFTQNVEKFICDAGDGFSPYMDTLWKAKNKGAMFDSRCFNIPKEEVTNLLYWRQIDAVRNSILSFGQYYYSQKELQNKTCADIKEMLLETEGFVYDEIVPIRVQRGTCCIKKNGKWEVDYEIPMFLGDGREYVEKRINFD